MLQILIIFSELTLKKYNSNNLSQLLADSQSGNQESYRLFFQIIVPNIKKSVARKVFHSDDIDDVVQEILLSIHRALASYDKNRAPLPWINTIIQRRIVDYIRKVTTKLKNEELTFDGDVTNFPDQPNISIGDDFLQAINKLPAISRRAIELTKIEGHTTKEAAKILNLKENALRTRISRSLLKLRKLIEQDV